MSIEADRMITVAVLPNNPDSILVHFFERLARIRPEEVLVTRFSERARLIFGDMVRVDARQDVIKQIAQEAKTHLLLRKKNSTTANYSRLQKTFT